MMNKGYSVVALAKLKVNTESLTESELIGVKDMMPIMFWICNFLFEQGEGIVVDLLLDNKGPSACKKTGKTPVWKSTRYVNMKLINITMRKKRRVKPNGVQVVTRDGNL